MNDQQHINQDHHPLRMMIKSRSRVAISACALISMCGSVVAHASDIQSSLQLKGGIVDVANLSNMKANNQARPQRLPDRVVVIVDGPMNPNWKSSIEATGAVMGDYLPDHAFVVDIKNARFEALRALDFVTHVVEFNDSWKVDQELGKRVLQTEARKAIAANGQIAVNVYLFASEQLKPAIAEISAQPGVEVVRNELLSDRFMIELVGDIASVQALKKIDSIQWIESAPEITLRNTTDRWVVQSNVNGFFPVYDAGIHGEDQLVAVMDGKVNVNHCAFSDPEGDPFGDDHRKIQAYNTSPGSDFHGTHVAGTVLGDNFANDNNRGVAYMSRMIFDTTPSFSFSAMTSRLSTHYNQGAAIHTNSWGDDGTTAYTGLARSIDTFSHDNDDNLVIFAATNLNSLKTPENAKNCLAVGASQDTPLQGSFCSGGIGPTADGRRKPEIFAPGCNTQSARWDTSCGTWGLTGTSMAAPAIAGTAALTRQYFEEGFYPSGLSESADGFTPSGTLLKATLLNSAVDMTGISGFPSNQEGWGRVLLDNALYFTGDSSRLILRDVRNASNDAMSTGDEYELRFTVDSVTEPMKATLVWHDAPASPNASFTPVNNLDLEIEMPSGDVLIGNNIVNGSSSFGGSADTINNVEMVMLPATGIGEYILRVKATEVNQGPQGFAIVLTGDVNEVSGGCNVADLAEPFGNLNFFDISAFLSAFNAQESVADINNDGVFNFFDISEYLSVFSAGCP